MARAPRAGLLAAALAVCALPASAQQWSLGGYVSQRFEADTNIDVEPDSSGGVYGSRTSVGLSLGATTSRTSWSLSTGTTISAYGGETEGTELNAVNPDLSGSVAYGGRRFQASANFGFSRQSTSFIDFASDPIFDIEDLEQLFEDGVFLPEDDLLIERDAIRTVFSSGAGVSYQLSPRNRLRMDASGTVVRYEDSAGSRLVPNSGYGASVGWDHDLGGTRSVGLSFAYRHFTADNAEQVESTTLTGGARYRQALTTDTGMSLGLGFSTTDTEKFFPGETARRSVRDMGFDGSFGLSFRGSDTVVDVSLTQGVRPSSTGELRNVTGLGGALNYRVNNRSTLTLSTRYSIQSELDSGGLGEGLDQAFFLSPVYSYRLTPDWSAQLGYSFRMIDDDFGTAYSNKVFVSVTRSLSFFP